jgi:hypothetical protein
MQDKRAATRYSFGVEQIVAGTIDGQMPPDADFSAVRCIDICQTGLAFYQTHRPNCKELVVGLGIEPNIVYLLARVVHVEMIELCGNLVFRVACEFTGRAQWSEQPKGILNRDDVDGPFSFLTDFAPQ